MAVVAAVVVLLMMMMKLMVVEQLVETYPLPPHQKAAAADRDQAPHHLPFVVDKKALGSH